MIPLVLWQLRWRIAVVVLIACAFYVIEPTLHVHAADEAAQALPPGEIAFSLANLAAASMLVLLAGFIATDRRRGYYRMYFAHPTRPLAYYALRWGIAYVVTLAVAAGFFVFAQLAAWGELRAGPSALLQPALFALIYGGMVAFASIAFPRGDSLIVLAVYALTDLWIGFLNFFSEAGVDPPLPPLARQVVSFVLPPHLALRDIYEVARVGGTAWGDIAFAGGYGLVWLAAAALLLWLREWP